MPMRVLLPMIVIVIVIAIAVLAARQNRRLPARSRMRAIEAPRWQAAHISRDGVTHVLVRRTDVTSGQVLDEREVVVVPDNDPDYEAKFMEAVATARARAELFNIEER